MKCDKPIFILGMDYKGKVIRSLCGDCYTTALYAQRMGTVTSAKKAEAARINGRLGGRPRKVRRPEQKPLDPVQRIVEILTGKARTKAKRSKKRT